MIVKLSREGLTKLDTAAITRVSQGAISKILKRSRETAAPNQRSPMLDKTGFWWEWCATICSIGPRLRVEFNRRIPRMSNVGPHHQSTTLTAGYPSCRPARCPRLIREHLRRRRQWARRHRDLGSSSLTIPASNHIAMMVEFESAGVKGRDILMLVCNKQMAM